MECVKRDLGLTLASAECDPSNIPHSLPEPAQKYILDLMGETVINHENYIKSEHLSRYENVQFDSSDNCYRIIGSNQKLFLTKRQSFGSWPKRTN